MTDDAQAAAGLDLTRLLTPRSVVIVGASEKPGALGNSVLRNLERAGFAGAIHLVNPRAATIGGRACVASVDDLPDDIDAAVLAVPRAAVLDTLAALARRRVGAAVIFAAGFAESGAAGAAEQREIAALAAAAGMIVEGPNCLGLVNFIDRVPLTFIQIPEPRVDGGRRVGVVSQSGAMAAVLATTMIAREVPLSCYISTGNEAASGAETYLAHLVASPDTAVIAMIVEHFRDPPRFLAAAAAARAAGKPIVLLHPGRSAAGAASAATHTGALAGDHAVMRVQAEHAGVLVVESLEELGDVAEIAARCPALPAGGTGIVAESGAFKAILLDLAETIGLALPVLGDADSPALRAALPDFVPVSNPLDVTAQGLVDPGLYGRTIAALLDDDRIGAVLVTLIQTETGTSSVKFAAVADALEALGVAKPVIVAGVDEGGGVRDTDVTRLRRLGVTVLPTAERAARALARIVARTRGEVAAHRSGAPLAGLDGADATIPEYRAKAVLAPRGIAFPPHRLVGTLDEAVAAAADVGYPVVLKAQAAALPHKSDAGGVVVGLADAAALADGWARLHRDVAAARPDLVLDGVLVEAMAERGIELIVGARHDPAWGPVILVGFGGVAAELLHDVRLLPVGLSHAAIVAEIRKLRLAPLLDGFRGAPRADIDAVAALVATLGDVVRDTPAIREIDLNPVIVTPDGVVALDALITVALDALITVAPPQSADLATS